VEVVAMSQWQFYVAGAGAGLLTSALDIVKNPTSGTVIRVGDSLQHGLLKDANVFLGPNFWAIVMLVAISAFVCWIFEVTSRLDGFLRGCTVLAAFSIGAPDPIINSQRDQTRIESGSINTPATHSQFPILLTPAFAQLSSDKNNPTTMVGNSFIILNHLKPLKNIPESIVTVQDATSFQRISIFKTSSYRFELTFPYGKYLTQVDTPGFSSIIFELTIDSPIAAYDVTAPTSSIPLAIQKLGQPKKVDLTEDEPEKFKQIGRKLAIAQDFASAIISYQKSLDIDATDSETRNFLAYAEYRAAKYSEAYAHLSKLLAEQPHNDISLINLLKVECVQGNYNDARRLFNEWLVQQKATWIEDGEFLRVCKQIIPK
jgi:hypothetical protein